MFTGIIQSLGRVASLTRASPGSTASDSADVQLVIEAPAAFMTGVEPGDSISVSGVCLTVTALPAVGFTADVSVETLTRTTFNDRVAGDPVNLEKALTLTRPLGGHLVSGHVDGVATLATRRTDGRSIRFEFEVPAPLSRYIAAKGSVCLEGVSLTVNGVEGQTFDVNLVPHTLAHTTLDRLEPGARVNLEVDLLARYCERLLQGGSEPESYPPQARRRVS